MLPVQAVSCGRVYGITVGREISRNKIVAIPAQIFPAEIQLDVGLVTALIPRFHHLFRCACGLARICIEINNAKAPIVFGSLVGSGKNGAGGNWVPSFERVGVIVIVHDAALHILHFLRVESPFLVRGQSHHISSFHGKGGDAQPHTQGTG